MLIKELLNDGVGELVVSYSLPWFVVVHSR